jgi:hypothetical protein
MTGHEAWNFYKPEEPFSETDPDLLPPYFMLPSIGPLSIYQIAFWDETRRKCEIGDTTSDTQTQFLRDEAGQVNLIIGKLRETQQKKFNAKYDNENRYGLGVAMVAEGTGKRAKPYDYTNKKLVTIKEWQERVNAEIERVKKLTDSGELWVTGKREAGEFYLEDPVKCE